MNETTRLYAEKSGAPLEIMHGEYKGRLVGVQRLNDGYVCGVYHFPGGTCCPAEAPVIKLRV